MNNLLNIKQSTQKNALRLFRVNRVDFHNDCHKTLYLLCVSNEKSVSATLELTS